MRDPTADYLLVELLGQSNSESVSHALAEGKTGNCEYDDFLPADIVQNAEAALNDFIKALEDYRANELINGSLK